ncbi:MAG: GTP-binding protein [Chloroflexi bacterium]|nr:MAG: GTP-binding protein [Chloroflexota bacterium]
MRLSLRRNGHQRDASCHSGPQANTQGLPEIAIVGSPNVGKSLLFQNLTGSYVAVSNYPGTTVEVYRGKGEIAGQPVAFVDTPGMYSLLPITEEERVARSILLQERPAAVIHVIDAKNLARMLPLTLQLLEADLPVILVVNIMDEAERLGIRIDTQALEEQLRIPVVATVSTTGQGIDQLKRRLAEYVNGTCHCHPV